MKKIHVLALQEIYVAATVALALLIFMESLKTGLVSAYVNLNYWLILWFLSGILYVYAKNNE